MSASSSVNINRERSTALPSSSPSSTSSLHGRQVKQLTTNTATWWSETSRELLSIAAIVGAIAIFTITVLGSILLNMAAGSVSPALLLVTIPIGILAIGLGHFTIKSAVGITPKPHEGIFSGDPVHSYKELSAHEKAFIRAAEDGDLSAIESHLKSGQPISKSALYRAVWHAADSGHLPIVKHLISSGRTISEIARCKAIWNAIESDQESVVEILLSNQKPIRTDRRDFLVSECAEKGNAAILKLLLQNGPITKAGRDFAIEQAKKEHADEIKQLLTKATLADTSWSYVLGALRAMYC